MTALVLAILLQQSPQYYRAEEPAIVAYELTEAEVGQAMQDWLVRHGRNKLPDVMRSKDRRPAWDGQRWWLLVEIQYSDIPKSPIGGLPPCEADKDNSPCWHPAQKAPKPKECFPATSPYYLLDHNLWNYNAP